MTNQPPRYVILAALAFDDTGELALREAASTAQRQQNAELHVIHVLPENMWTDLSGDPSLGDGKLAEAREQLRVRVEALVSTRALRIVAHVRAGPQVPNILALAAELDADLIVLGTHQRTGIRKLILGSVAEQLLRDAHCPVLVAVTKDHSAAIQNSRIEPPCPECVSVRVETAGASYWCKRHSRSRLRPHVYEP